MKRMLVLSTAALSLTAIPALSAAPPPIDAFARLPDIRSVAVSPNGEKLVWITSRDDRELAVTLEWRKGQDLKVVLASEPGKFSLSGCGWANDTRLLCGVRAMSSANGSVFPVTRLVAVNADGSEQKVLLERFASGQGFTQFHDQILHWTPDAPDTVLMALDDDRNQYPSVFELNVNTGAKSIVIRDHPPIRRFVADGAGNVRLGSGFESGKAEIEYFARLEGDKEWRSLLKIKPFAANNELTPIAMAPGTNRAYAQGTYEGRSALWEIDLTDQREPVLVFSHPLVDASTPVMTSDRRLVGIAYETDRPFVHYTDEGANETVRAINKQLPGKFNVITSVSKGGKVLIVRSANDVDAGTWYALDNATSQLTRLGTGYPELDQSTLGRMQSIAYKAQDGTEIPGYLTVPAGVRAEKLPLIVMPHGGPIARDSWEFDFLREFMASRGYAVLQMNFRGSSGYGDKWQQDAHQDWGGLTYSDIVDGARWSIEKGIADPKRMCIVGWSFGGYSALVGAVRNPDLFRCSASIAGLSDLAQLRNETRRFANWRLVKEQIGTDTKKLKEDSPARHAEAIAMPVLLIHGDKDAQADIDQSRKMDSALKSARKPHRAVFIEDATHQMDRKSDRVTLLTELEKFLLENLGPGTTQGS